MRIDAQHHRYRLLQIDNDVNAVYPPQQCLPTTIEEEVEAPLEGLLDLALQRRLLKATREKSAVAPPYVRRADRCKDCERPFDGKA